MSFWTDRVANHVAGSALRDMVARLERLLAREDTPSEALEGLNRLNQVVMLANRRFSGMDPNLVTPSMLDTLVNRLQSIEQPVGQFEAQPNPTFLEQANSSADALLDSLPGLPGIQTIEDAGDLREAIASLRLSVGQHLRRASDEVARLEESVGATRIRAEALGQEIAVREGRLEDAISRANDQHTTAQSTRASEFVGFMAGRVTDAQEAERQRTEAFASEQTQRELDWSAELRATAESFAAKRAELETAAGDALEELTLRAQRWETASSEQGASALSKLEGFRKKAEELVGIIGQTGMVHGFQTVANEAGTQRKFWVKVAAWSLVGLIGSSIAFLSPIPLWFGLALPEPSWEGLATRVFLSLTFVALAVFAGNQASRLESAERQNRQRELELTALGPFLADLSPDERNEIVKQMADRMFGQRATEVEPSRDVRLPVEAALDLAKQAMDLAAKKS